MPSGAQRALAFSINLAINGVPLTILRAFPDQAAIETRGIWELPADEPQLYGVDLKRAGPRRVLALPKLTGTQAQKGTVILAPEPGGSEAKRWIADGYARPVEPDVVRVFVIAAQG